MQSLSERFLLKTPSKHFVVQLLTVYISFTHLTVHRYRLGVLSGLEVLQHPWVSSVDWENLRVTVLPEGLSFSPLVEIGP